MRSGEEDLLLSVKLLGDIMIGLLGDLSGENRGDKTAAMGCRLRLGLLWFRADLWFFEGFFC